MKFIIGLMTILIFSGCASMKLEKDKVDQVKRVAIVGYSVEQRMPNTAKGLLSGDFEGGLKAHEIAIEADHATEMYDNLVRHLSQKLNWEVLTRKDLSYSNERVAESEADLFNTLNTSLEADISYDEAGVVTAGLVWTGSDANGERVAGVTSCFNWTSASELHHGKYGIPSAVDNDYLDFGLSQCDNDGSLYCISREPLEL